MKALIAILWFVGTALASTPDPSTAPGEAEAAIPAELPGMTPGTPPPADRVERIAQELGEILRCPVCQGLSVADSTSPAAVNMQRRIQELVASGYSDEQILDYFVSKYGEWILLRPRTGGMNWIIWLGPALAFALGLALATTVAQSGEDDTSGDSAPPPDDAYTKQLLAELQDEQA